MKNQFILFLCVVIQCSAFSQLENMPLVTVYGEARVKVKPDQVILGIKIRKKIVINSTEGTTALELFKTEDTKIRLFGFDPKNMTETLIQPDSGSYIKEVFITITDLTTLDKYLLELNKLGFKDFIYLDYRLKDYNTYKTQAKKEAIASARKKATLLAAEVGQTIGKAHRIEELSTEDYNWYNLQNETNPEQITFKLGADGYIIEPGYLTLTSKIKVSFDLIK